MAEAEMNILQLLPLWGTRHRHRRELIQMSARDLRDANVPRDLVGHEARKWPWQSWNSQWQELDEVSLRKIAGRRDPTAAAKLPEEPNRLGRTLTAEGSVKLAAGAARIYDPAKMKYHGFLSYSRAADGKLAPALQQSLHSLARPWYRFRLIHVFRDLTSLSANPELWGSIEAALADSEHFLLMASPEAAGSKWVRQEVKWWLANRPVNKLLIILTDGEARWDAAANDFDWSCTSALPADLRRRFEQEPLWVDLRWAKGQDQLSLHHSQFRAAVLDLAAPLLGRPKDELDGEDVRRLRTARRLAGGTIITLSLLLLMAIIASWQFLIARGNAIRNESTALRNEGMALGALSDIELKQGHPVDAVRLALAAWPRKGDEKRPQMRQVIDALLSAESEQHERVRFDGHPNAVRSAAFSPDGERIVTASDDKKVRIWDAQTGEHLRTLEGHSGTVWTVIFSPDGKRIVTASEDKTVRIWNPETGQRLRTLEGHGGPVNSAAFSPDGSQIITASDDQTACIWDAQTGERLKVIKGHRRRVDFAAFSPDGARIVTASKDKLARIWDARSGESLIELKGHEEEVHSAAFSPDGSQIVTASEDKTARIWNARKGEVLAELPHPDHVAFAEFSPDSARVITASDDNTARIWDARTGSILVKLKGHDGVVNFAGFSADGTRVVTASDDRTARIWDAAEVVGELKGHEDYVYSVAFSRDGASIVTASKDGTVRIWDAGTRVRRATLNGHEGAATFAAFDHKGDRIVAAYENKTALIWSAKTGEVLTRLNQLHDDWVLSAVFSPDGSQIVTASEDKTARIWNAGTGEALLKLRHPDQVTFAEFSPDGALIVTASSDKIARIWDARTGEVRGVLVGHGNSLRDAAFSRDGTRIVTASEDNTARVWNAKTGEPTAVLKGHHDIVWGAAFSPDGSRIVTASADRTARIWNAKTGELIAALAGHRKGVDTAVFSPDGARIATASEDKTARIWNNLAVDAEDVFAVACRGLGAKTDLVDLANRYGLTELKPICGSNSPKKVDLTAILD